jgi:hypothetical protein
MTASICITILLLAFMWFVHGLVTLHVDRDTERYKAELHDKRVRLREEMHDKRLRDRWKDEVK